MIGLPKLKPTPTVINFRRLAVFVFIRTTIIVLLSLNTVCQISDTYVNGDVK